MGHVDLPVRILDKVQAKLNEVTPFGEVTLVVEKGVIKYLKSTKSESLSPTNGGKNETVQRPG